MTSDSPRSMATSQGPRPGWLTSDEEASCGSFLDPRSNAWEASRLAAGLSAEAWIGS